MIRITLAQDMLPFNFLDEIGLSYTEIAIDFIRQKKADLSQDEYYHIFEKFEDAITEALYQLQYSSLINDCFVSEIEIDEATGTWGYSEYEIDDEIILRNELEKEINVLLEDVFRNKEHFD